MKNNTNLPGFKIIGIDHVAVAVKETATLTDFFSQLPGIDYNGSENISYQKILTDIFATSNGKIELVSPTEEGSPLTKFLEKRGIGMHHIALKVDNIEKAISYMKFIDVKMVDTKPRIGAEGLLIAFVHPKSTPGLLIEFCQSPA